MRRLNFLFLTLTLVTPTLVNYCAARSTSKRMYATNSTARLIEFTEQKLKYRPKYESAQIDPFHMTLGPLSVLRKASSAPFIFNYSFKYIYTIKTHKYNCASAKLSQLNLARAYRQNIKIFYI